MAKVSPLDLRKDSETNPEISQLIRGIMYGDPFAFAEGTKDGVPYVIIGAGLSNQFTFTKVDGGYFFEKTK